MAIIRVIFYCSYDYDIAVDDEVYEEFPGLAENDAIERAYDQFCEMRRTPIADTSYDKMEVEVL